MLLHINALHIVQISIHIYMLMCKQWPTHFSIEILFTFSFIRYKVNCVCIQANIICKNMYIYLHLNVRAFSVGVFTEDMCIYMKIAKRSI